MSEQTKTSPPQEQPYPPPNIVPYPHQAYNGAPFPPPGPPGTYMPPFFAYPPPPDGSHPEGQNGVPPAPYMMALPPGVVYAYPPHPQAPGMLISNQSSEIAAHFTRRLRPSTCEFNPCSVGASKTEASQDGRKCRPDVLPGVVY